MNEDGSYTNVRETKVEWHEDQVVLSWTSLDIPKLRDDLFLTRSFLFKYGGNPFPISSEYDYFIEKIPKGILPSYDDGIHDPCYPKVVNLNFNNNVAYGYNYNMRATVPVYVYESNKKTATKLGLDFDKDESIEILDKGVFLFVSNYKKSYVFSSKSFRKLFSNKKARKAAIFNLNDY